MRGFSRWVFAVVAFGLGVYVGQEFLPWLLDSRIWEGYPGWDIYATLLALPLLVLVSWGLRRLTREQDNS